MERSFDNDAMDVTCTGVEKCKENSPNVDDVYDETVVERTLDAIYQHDDGDETKSLIWFQCRICKWSLPVELYVDGNCLCNWDQEAALEEEMARLSLLPPPPLDDFDDVSIHTAPEALEFTYTDSTDSEPSDNTTEELPSLNDGSEMSEHDESEMQQTEPIEIDECVESY